MAGKFLNDKEREHLDCFPQEIIHEDVVSFFTLSSNDLTQLPKHTADYNRLGFAIQLCALRYLGFCPDRLDTIPPYLIDYVAEQLDVEPSCFAEYGHRAQTKTEHLQLIMGYLSFRKASIDDFNMLSTYLLERALEHNRPIVLFELAIEKLYTQKIYRPGITRIEQMIITIREQAKKEIYQHISSSLTLETKTILDKLLLHDETKGSTPLVWLRKSQTSNSPGSILNNLQKIKYIQELGTKSWSLTNLNQNCIRHLAQLGRKTNPQNLRITNDEYRYPVLIAFLNQSLIDIIDETIDMYNQCLFDAYRRARHSVEAFRKDIFVKANEKVILFRDIVKIILNTQIPDQLLREAVYKHVSSETLASLMNECEQIIRPKDDNYFDFLQRRYSYIRQFAPSFINSFTFYSTLESKQLLDALLLLHELNINNLRKIPHNAPVGFVGQKWRPYVIDKDDQIDRSFYELCALLELRNALRAGNVWVEGSRRYAKLDTYLLNDDRFGELKKEICSELHLPLQGTQRLSTLQDELERLLSKFDTELPSNDKVRIENGNLVVSPLEAEEKSQSSFLLEQQIDKYLPYIELSSLLIEVDKWTSFSECFQHPEAKETKSKDLSKNIYASILAQGCNIGMTRMAQIANLGYDKLARCNNWYIREETLKEATDTIVNYLHHQVLSQYWGTGTLSSSDGQRFPMAVNSRNATAIVRYFGLGRGITFYTWTSDQYSQYGTKVICSTTRDATYVLDAILDNETELSIIEHTTDTLGYTDLVFALFDLLNMRFSPRIRDIGEQRLFRIDEKIKYNNIEHILKGKINCKTIVDNWDNLVKVAGSLKLGWVTASLLISKLQSYTSKNELTKTLQEYGRLIKTIFILRYLTNEDYRRKINKQLNKGEALHALRRFIFFAQRGQIYKSQIDDQANQASCLNLITNAVTCWNTVYMNVVIEQLKKDGFVVSKEDIAHLSPARYEHINPYGKYYFNIEEEFSRDQLRPLRTKTFT